MENLSARQLSKEEAIAFCESGKWKEMSDEEVFQLQMFQDLLCVDFGRFHQATEKVLGRPVFTHEFASPKGLIDEYLGKRGKPSLEDIIGLIPRDKLIIVAKG